MKTTYYSVAYSFLLLILFSCGRGSVIKTEPGNIQNDTFILPAIREWPDTCISPAFQKCIASYIDKYYGEYQRVGQSGNSYRSFDGFYCCIYFFRKESTDYFTIWILHSPPNKWVEGYNSGMSFQYYWFIYHKQEIILIFDPSSDQELPFHSCIDQLDSLEVTYLPAEEYIASQDLFNFRTYRYTPIDGDFQIELLRDTIYLGNEIYLGREIRLLKRENGLED